MLDDLIEKLRVDLELEEIATDAPGIWSLPLEDNKQVKISTVPQGFYLECRFGSYPEKKQRPFFTHALHANLYCNGTEGKVLGIDEEDKCLVLSEVVEKELEYSSFKETLEEFINAIDFWEEEARSFN